MKKSEIYHLAQYAVLSDSAIANYQKLQILRELMDKEDVALYCEKQEKENEDK